MSDQVTPSPDGDARLPELPQPDFHLAWRNGEYKVSKPNVDAAEVYTAEQMRTYGEACARAIAGAAEPVAWIRQHPDGTLTNETLPNWMIEPVRKASGAWLPLVLASPPPPTQAAPDAIARSQDSEPTRSDE
jgi:hypothetical protein